MKFSSNNFYHVFNRGNNKQNIFPRSPNYDFFKLKIKKLISPHCDLVAYCLMPNHFHILLYINERDVTFLPNGKMQVLERQIGTLQSSYSRAINIQEKKTGSLFQAKCKVIELRDRHPFTAFHYIHQNPIKAGLSKKMDDWKYSSYGEYSLGLDGICNKNLAYTLLGIPSDKSLFDKQSHSVIAYEHPNENSRQTT